MARRRKIDQPGAHSFQPRQFHLPAMGANFRSEAASGDQDDHLDVLQWSDIMWVYRRMSDVWAVGFYAPSGEWNLESEWTSKEDAAKRVHWLSGGD